MTRNRTTGQMDIDTRDLIHAMLRCSHYTDEAIARHADVTVQRVARMRISRGCLHRPPDKRWKRWRGGVVDERADDWQEKARVGSENLARAITNIR